MMLNIDYEKEFDVLVNQYLAIRTDEQCVFLETTKDKLTSFQRDKIFLMALSDAYKAFVFNYSEKMPRCELVGTAKWLYRNKFNQHREENRKKGVEPTWLLT